jgi:MFS family permease
MLGGAASDFVLNTTGSRRLARQGVAITGLLGCAVFVFAAYFIEDPRQAVLIISAGSFCAALAGPAGYTTTMEMGGAHVATVCATMNMVGNLGAAMFPVLVPWLLLWRTAGGPPTENWDVVLFAFGGVYLLAAGFWLLLNPHGTVFDQSLWRRGASRQAE